MIYNPHLVGADGPKEEYKGHTKEDDDDLYTVVLQPYTQLTPIKR
jgi:hypothetical protein